MSDYDNNVDNLDMDGKHKWQNRLICTIAVLGKALEVYNMTLASKRWRFAGIEHYSNRAFPDVRRYVGSSVIL